MNKEAINWNGKGGGRERERKAKGGRIFKPHIFRRSDAHGDSKL